MTDCAALLRRFASYDPKDCTSIKRDITDFHRALDREDVKGMKIGIPKDYLGEGLDPEVKEAILGKRQSPEEKGAIVENFALSLWNI